MDLGSGATFFPFAIARLGASVIAADADARATTSIDRATCTVTAGQGAVSSLLCDARAVPLETESVDGVYCISVLEHIPDFETVIAEVRRILRPGGIFVLTFDVDLRGNSVLDPSSYTRLMHTLRASFSLVYPEHVIHPLRVLTSDNSIYPMYRPRSSLRVLISSLRNCMNYVFNKLRGRALSQGRVQVSTYGALLTKNVSSEL